MSESWNDRKEHGTYNQIENLLTSPCKSGEHVGRSYLFPLGADLEPFHASVTADWVCRCQGHCGKR